MSEHVNRQILDRLRKVEREAVRKVLAEVTDDDPLTIKIAGSDVEVAAHRCSTYTPTVGDIVLVLQSGGTVVVIDELT